jgi:hypothetical protein
MRSSRRNLILLSSLPVLVFITWFGWMTYSQSRIHWIETKVKQAMVASIDGLAPQWPRVEYRDNLSRSSYFVPDIYNQALVFDLYRHTLEQLNQDTSVPPLKIFRISIFKTGGISEDVVTMQAYLEFPMIGGVEKELVVMAKDHIAHYSSDQ